MLKVKKIFSAFVGIAMAANVLTTMPFSAFADEETTNRTYIYDDYEVSYDVTNSWGNTEKISVTISNTGDSTIENWMLSYDDFNGDIDGIWDATVVEVDAENSYIRNAGYNANIAPNASISFGYNLTNPESVPESIVMCQKRVTKSNNDFSASLNVTNDWGSAFNAEILLRNDMDKPLEWWELDFDTNFTITEITTSWAAEKFNLGDASYMFKGTYTGIVPPQSTVTLGFSGVKNESLDEPMITVNGLTEVVFGGFPGNVDIESARQAELEYVKGLNENTKYPAEFGFNNNGTVYSIDGKFSNVAVVDAESALLALNDVKNLLGMSDPASQLVFETAYSNETTDFTVFYFYEVYKDVKVFDRNVTVVARNNGETMSLSSNFLALPDNFNITPLISEDAVESEYQTDKVDLSIYSFEEYENIPLLIYICETDDMIIIISSNDGTVITSYETEITDIEESNEDVIDYDIYNIPDVTNLTMDENDNIIYAMGNFGTVNNVNESPTLSFNNGEKEELKINDPNITFKFASKGETFISQTIPDDEYDQYTHNHKVVFIESNSGSTSVNVAVDEYHFDQIYQGIKVYGRVITETVNDNGDTIIIDSNVLSKEALNQAMSNITAQNNSSIENVISVNSSLASLEPELNEPVLYTWNEYSENPVLVFIFLDRANNRTYLVSAESENYGQILNESDDKYQLGKGLDEGTDKEARRLQYFPILEEGTMGFSKSFGEHSGTMAVYNPTRSIVGSAKIVESPVQSLTTYFYEPEAVAAYMNSTAVYEFYATNFNHYFNENNRNNRDSILKIYYKKNSMPGALASAGNGYINLPIRNMSRRSNGSGMIRTVAHEYTHTVFHAFNGGIPSQYTITRGVNEGYAYLFGYNIFAEWNSPIYAFMPSFSVDFENSRLEYLIENGHTTKDGHSISPYVIYPAKLMLDNGLTKSEIAQLYYNSLVMGRYNYDSTLNSVRVNVIKSAKALGLDDAKLTIVREALDEVWEKDNRVYDFTLNVKEYLNPNVDINNVTVTLKKNLDEDSLISKESGGFVYTVEPGCTYLLEVSAPGYVTYRNKVHMYYMENNSHTAELIKINYDTNGNEINGSALIKAVDRVTNLPVGAIVKFQTYDESFNKVYLTDDTGTVISYLAAPETGYTNSISIAPGYYYPIVSEADNYFVKPMMTVASGNEIPDESKAFIYYDTNMKGDLKSYFFSIAVNEYHETETSFKAFDTLTVITDADTYVGRSGPTQFGKELYMVCYEPEMETSFDFVFRPNSEQLEKLEAILKSEGNLCIDPNTGKNALGHLGYDENNNRIVIAEPSSKSYYNIEIAGNNIGITNPTVISAWELYEGLMNNNGVYPLSKIIFDGNGQHSFQ